MTEPGHYRRVRAMREREVIDAAKRLAKVHHENGTINEAGRALAELRGAVAVLEGAERDALHERPRVDVERIPGDGRWVRVRVGAEGVALHPDEVAKLRADLERLDESALAQCLRRARDHIARKLALATAGQGVLLTNEDAALLVEALSEPPDRIGGAST